MFRAYSWNYIKRNGAMEIPVIAAAFTSALFLSCLGGVFYNLWKYDADGVSGFGETPSDMTLLSVFYLLILLLVSAALVLIIHNAFAVSMNARIHQFGIFSSVGAAPGQILICLVQEAVVLGCVPILLGSLGGTVLSFAAVQWVNRLGADIAGRREAVFHFSLPLFGAVVLLSGLTLLFSAWLPARKLSRMTPLQAIRSADGLHLKKKTRFSVLALLFGVEGKLAGRSLKAQRKALRTSTLSLTLSFLGFTLMTCFFTLSEISTQHTYFERYQDAWDVMVTLRDRKIGDWTQGERIKSLPGVGSSIAYQKAEAVCLLPEAALSGEVQALGGLQTLAGEGVGAGEEGYLVPAPLVIMDDRDFGEYCAKIHVEPQGNGSIVLNRIWDSKSSNFRYKAYIPFLQEGVSRITLQSAGQAQEPVSLQEAGQAGHSVEIPVIASTQEPPLLREEYKDYALVQFISVSLWKQIGGQIGQAESEPAIRICVLAKNGITLSEAKELEKEILQVLSDAETVGTENGTETVEIENRLQEKQDDEKKRQGFMTVLGAFCALLALIGIANVFSNTMGFVRQRRREFAQYQSVGLTPAGMYKVFAIEALFIAGRPVLITLPVTAAAVAYMIRASFLDPMEFLEKAPVTPIALFMLSIFGFVAMAYGMGARKLLGHSFSGQGF